MFFIIQFAFLLLTAYVRRECRELSQTLLNIIIFVYQMLCVCVFKLVN